MTAAVFISHASLDAAMARDVVAALEAHGEASWISSRDIAPGANYQEAIVAAIRTGRALVLLLTEAANASDEVKKELALASAAGIPVFPIRLGTVTPNPALSYELATRQWIDAADAHAAIPALRMALAGTAPPPSVAAPFAAEPPALPLPDKPSLVVLPFANLSGDPEQEYFADGMTEEVTTALSRIRSFFVIARNSAFTYKGRTVDARQAGRDLGVRYLVEGSVRKAGRRVRITAQLIEATTASHLWADRFDGALDDVFDLQDRVTSAIAAAIEPSLRTAEIARVHAKPTSNLAAYDLVLRGLPLLNSFTPDGLAEGLELLRRAIELDPEYGLAHIYIGMGHWWEKAQFIRSSSAEEALASAARARKAIALAPDDPEVLAYGGFLIAAHGDPEGGRGHLERALRLNPNASIALGLLAQVHGFQGNVAAARACASQAIRLSPAVTQRQAQVGEIIACFVAGDMPACLAAADELVRQAPNWSHGWRTRTVALVQLGRIAEARAAAAELLRVAPLTTVSRVRALIAPFPDDGVHQNQFSAEDTRRYCDSLRIAGVPE